MADFITFLRIVLSPMLLAFEPFSFWFCLVYIACGLTDLLDGLVARALKQETKLGSMLDSIADAIFLFSSLIALGYQLNLDLWHIIGFGVVLLLKCLSLILGKGIILQRHSILDKALGLLIFALPLYIWFKVTVVAYPVLLALAMYSRLQELFFILETKKEQGGRPCS